MKTLTQKHIEQIESWPKGMKGIYFAADKCIKRLLDEGEAADAAEEAVLTVLRENEEKLVKKQYKSVLLTLSHTFLSHA